MAPSSDSLQRHRPGLRASLRKRLPTFALIGCLLVGGALTEGVVTLARERVQEQRSAAASLFLSGVRARLEGAVSLVETVSEQIANAVRQRPFLSEAEFIQEVREAREAVPLIRHISLAPDNVNKAVEPLPGNEMVLGLHYEDLPEQWATLEEARQKSRNVLAGPVELVQGGTAFILRIPIFVRRLPYHPDFPMRYWGVLSTVVEEKALLQVAGLDDHTLPLQVGWRSESRGDHGIMVAGSAEAYGSGGTILPVRVPGGAWTLAARPTTDSPPEVMLVRIAGWTVSVLTGGLLFAALRAHRRAEDLALRDHLTGLPNRRLLLERLEQLVALSDRTGMRFAVFYFDLDGFKPVNDRFGHRVGDQLLIEIGSRVREVIRRSDTLARIGGDEFVLVSAETASEGEAEMLAARVRGTIAAAYSIDGETIHLGTSIGSVLYPTDADSVHQLLEEADARMYSDKTRRAKRTV